MSLATLNDVFFAAVERKLDRAQLYRVNGEWQPISSPGFGRNVARVAHSLHKWGIGKGDRVAILSENRPEWTTADFAALLLGAVTVPIYATLTAEQTVALLSDSGARLLFLSSQLQVEKIAAVLGQTRIERVVIMDSAADASRLTVPCVEMGALTAQGPQQLEPALEAVARAVQPDDLATLIYTSGTTGTSKGVMLTHGNMASNISCSLQGFGIDAGEIMLSFLPLSHVTARHVDLAMLYHGVTLAYCPFMDHLPTAFVEVKPTICVAVPRVYEKIYQQTERTATGFAKRRAYQWALSVGKSHREPILAGQTPTSHDWRLADRLVFSRIRAGLGGKVKTFISGGAPLGRELAEWYAAVGIRIHEGYGLTETSPVIAVNTPEHHRIGTVGRVLSNLEVRIAEDGEILVRGPSVFKGYWNRPDETEQAFVDGFFKTGDIGDLDADGYLSVTDRKKDLIKTSGGKFIAPQPIENTLKLNPLIGTCAVLGDKRKFAAVLISPNFAALEAWAHENNVQFASREELVANTAVSDLYDGVVEQVNQGLARFETLKKVILVPDEFSAENGALTPSLKLRRRVIYERYQQQINDLYRKAETDPRK
jgi:long-chain acyl-CoA synthetase